MKLKIFLRFYYFSLLSFVCVFWGRVIFSFYQGEVNYLWAVKFLDYSGSLAQVFQISMFLVLVLSLIASLVKTELRWIRIVVAIVFFFELAFVSSFGKIDHVLYGYLFVNFYLGLMKTGEGELNRECLKGAQNNFLLLYFMSGLWKLRFTASALFKSSESVTHILSDFLKSELIFNVVQGGRYNAFNLRVIETESLSAVLWVMILVIEVGSGAVMLSKKLKPYWGALIVIFHLGAWNLMGISFLPHIILAVLLLMIPFKTDFA